jgi:hypothetical protein
MVKTRRGTVLRSRAETSTLVAKKRSSKRLREEDATKTLQSPTGADSAAIIIHQLGDVDSCADVDINGSDQSTIKSISRPIRRRAVQTRETPYRKPPANQDSKVVNSACGIQDLTTECLVAIFERVEDEAYVRLVMPLVCKRWASILRSPSDVYKVQYSTFFDFFFARTNRHSSLVHCCY